VDSFTGSLPANLVETGQVKLSWNQNDTFAAAEVLPGPNGTTFEVVGGDTTGASAETGEPLHAGKPGGRSIWYSWTAPKSGTVQFNTTPSDIDTLLAAYTGNDVRNLTEVASNDDFGGITRSQITFRAKAGTTYRIAVDGKNAAAGITILKYAFLA
jgi:hypothetical protein